MDRQELIGNLKTWTREYMQIRNTAVELVLEDDGLWTFLASRLIETNIIEADWDTVRIRVTGRKEYQKMQITGLQNKRIHCEPLDRPGFHLIDPSQIHPDDEHKAGLALDRIHGE